MKLNVGSGAVPSPLAGWTNLDATAWPVHIQADAMALPFRAGAFETVHCSHVIEHVPERNAAALLYELRRVMRRDATLYISGPDGSRTKDIDSSYWSYMTRHGGNVPGWQHEWTCTVARLRRMLLAVGLVPSWAMALPQGHPLNTHSWPLDLEARFICRRDDFGWPRSFPPGYQVIV